ncbi:hypothetical protein EJ06DRAFT_527536 [Trichodelitschia bisporula]|uniref:Uncharacterized protein n=1 Tax=Trichodelitschia bisporula TaxID=703511 RepID=A0A6G1I6Z5_9PEZI|nr:hypothetical protein EJ06DRAFT_527536 [Trichodelitschia bisporula]
MATEDAQGYEQDTLPPFILIILFFRGLYSSGYLPQSRRNIYPLSGMTHFAIAVKPSGLAAWCTLALCHARASGC